MLARELSFTDPISGEERRFTSQRTLPWPDEDVR
jgi:tRNA pseudouridine32 synthase/23S rRNA pseudouridine746 synthase